MNVDTKPYNLPGHVVLREPALRFGSTDPKAVDPHPLQGLLRFGPFTRNKLAAIVDPIRVAIIAPSDQVRRVEQLLREMQQAQSPRERRDYLPAFPGSQRSSTVQMGVAGRKATIELPADMTDQMKRAQRPHLVLAEALTRALSALRNNRAAFDVVFILLSQEWEEGFFGGSEDDFNLHHYVKAVAPSKGYRRNS